MEKQYFLISHNEYSKGIEKTIEMILGKQDNLKSYSLMPGGHPDEITTEIEKCINEESQIVILGDIAGGSVCNSALRLTVNPNVTLVTGINIPVALEIIRKQVSEKNEIKELVERTKASMRMVDLN